MAAGAGGGEGKDNHERGEGRQGERGTRRRQLRREAGGEQAGRGQAGRQGEGNDKMMVMRGEVRQAEEGGEGW